MSISSASCFLRVAGMIIATFDASVTAGASAFLFIEKRQTSMTSLGSMSNTSSYVFPDPFAPLDVPI